MTLQSVLKEPKQTWYIKIHINNKFWIFGCMKSHMKENDNYNMICGFEDLYVDYTRFDHSYLGNPTFNIYVTSDELEKRCLLLENMWYDTNKKYLKKGANIYEFEI